MTHEEILGKLRDLNYRAVASVVEEDLEIRAKYLQSSAKFKDALVGETRWFAEEVSNILENSSVSMTPSNLVKNRRAALTWAVAEILRSGIFESVVKYEPPPTWRWGE